MIERILNIENLSRPGKTLLLLGPRRSGKTTLLKQFLSSTARRTVFYDGGNLSVQQQFSINEYTHLKAAFEGYDVLAIDEAQNIPGIGMSLKLINDASPSTIVIATGSSSLDMRGQVGEPLVGRKRTEILYPFSLEELFRSSHERPLSLSWKEAYPNLLRFGMYPSSVLASNNQERAAFLRELIDSLLLRDILMYQEVKGAHLLLQLLTLLAYQIGSEVSLTELGASLGIRKETVARYLDLFEKSFIIFRLGGLSRKLRSEVTRKAKYYFCDLGVRNAIINNFSPLETRNDGGLLWENFAIVERLKARSYRSLFANQYFWRTWERSEIDLVEERDGSYFAYEMKLNPRKVRGAPRQWVETYGSNAPWQIITPDNILDFVLLD
jgi:predicted AAA+ superfamily ATPase